METKSPSQLILEFSSNAKASTIRRWETLAALGALGAIAVGVIGVAVAIVLAIVFRAQLEELMGVFIASFAVMTVIPIVLCAIALTRFDRHLGDLRDAIFSVAEAKYKTVIEVQDEYEPFLPFTFESADGSLSAEELQRAARREFPKEYPGSVNISEINGVRYFDQDGNLQVGYFLLQRDDVFVYGYAGEEIKVRQSI